MNRILPLEKYLEIHSRDINKFPNMSTNYYANYIHLVNSLRSNIYPNIGAGLAANSEISGFYTSHDAEHFDQVVYYAGMLLGVNNDNYETQELSISPYEVYALLIAIRIHDAGNIFGRESHEKHCYTILKDHLPTGHDGAEARNIANIAEAHGGNVNGDKDTISLLLPPRTSNGSHHLNNRVLAAILRFADEICENRTRSASYLLAHDRLPGHSKIYHKYAAAIKSNYIENHKLHLVFTIQDHDVTTTLEYNGAQKYLIDVIYDRLEKMNLERIYCNKFTKRIYTIDAIRASISIVDSDWQNLDEIVIPEISDEKGYPDYHSPLETQKETVSGAIICERIRRIRDGS